MLVVYRVGVGVFSGQLARQAWFVVYLYPRCILVGVLYFRCSANGACGVMLSARFVRLLCVFCSSFDIVATCV